MLPVKNTKNGNKNLACRACMPKRIRSPRACTSCMPGHPRRQLKKRGKTRNIRRKPPETSNNCQQNSNCNRKTPKFSNSVAPTKAVVERPGIAGWTHVVVVVVAESPASRRKVRVLRQAVLACGDRPLLYDKLAISNTYSHAQNYKDPWSITWSKMTLPEVRFSAVDILGDGWLQSPPPMAHLDHLNQCCVTVNWTLGNKIQWNFNQNTKFSIRENVSENIVCEITAILSKGRSVDLCTYAVVFFPLTNSATAPRLVLCRHYSCSCRISSKQRVFHHLKS